MGYTVAFESILLTSSKYLLSSQFYQPLKLPWRQKANTLQLFIHSKLIKTPLNRFYDHEIIIGYICALPLITGFNIKISNVLQNFPFFIIIRRYSISALE